MYIKIFLFLFWKEENWYYSFKDFYETYIHTSQGYMLTPILFYGMGMFYSTIHIWIYIYIHIWFAIKKYFPEYILLSQWKFKNNEINKITDLQILNRNMYPTYIYTSWYPTYCDKNNEIFFFYKFNRCFDLSCF